jgi:hypothetical protein
VNLDDLTVMEQLRGLKAAYFRLLDAQDWVGLRELFTDDATFDHPVLGQFDDIETAIAGVRSRSHGRTTVHVGYLPEFTVDGDTASAIWQMSSFSTTGPPLVRLSDSHRHAPGLRTYGFYTDTFRRSDDTWLISTLKLTTVYREVD